MKKGNKIGHTKKYFKKTPGLIYKGFLLTWNEMKAVLTNGRRKTVLLILHNVSDPEDKKKEN